MKGTVPTPGGESLTWRRIPGFDFKWAYRVIVDPRDLARIFITTFGGSVRHGKVD